jgi:serine/threonine protein kinase
MGVLKLCVCLLYRCGTVQHEKFQSAPGSRVGTPAYLAPEVILTTRGKTYDGKVRRGT